MSQEELAARLSVVRQTVSKWETGRSVPDAEMVIRIAALFQVSVQELLGIEEETHPDDLAKELARVNQQLAQQMEAARIGKLADRKRGIILMLSFLALLAALALDRPVVSVVLVGLCFLGALWVFYRNIGLLTHDTTSRSSLPFLRAITVLNGLFLILCVTGVVLWQTGVITGSEQEEKLLAAALISGVMVFSSIIAPKLPFNRYVGLRLPWTVQDEETWNIAHKTLGITALPVAAFYLAAAYITEAFDLVTLISVLVWIGCPGLISLWFFRRKYHGS
ncbi:XRE family transcriptional regulator [Evtepia sp.]|uniref:XRE family transcriptional regulator n=1 Tax=Evtepia sp. TaxID=2773933 RepID=UPI002A76316A|nr:XRE family transcriptional regulator [Evtepia sp.]